MEDYIRMEGWLDEDIVREECALNQRECIEVNEVHSLKGVPAIRLRHTKPSSK